MLLKPAHRLASIEAKQAHWAGIYSGVSEILNFQSNGRALQVPFGDPTYENSPTAPTLVTTRGAEQVDFTYTNSGRHLWATQLGYEGPGQIPVLYFDGSTDWLETPDATFWNDTAGASEPSYCWAMWVFVVPDGASKVIISKSEQLGTTGTDWIIFADFAERVICRIIDDSANAYIGQKADDILSGWHHIAFTKHDDSALSSSILSYLDGELASDATNEAGTYVAQEDGVLAVRIGARLDGLSPWNGAMAGGSHGLIFEPVGAGAVWTPNQIRDLYQLQAPQLIYGWTA